MLRARTAVAMLAVVVAAIFGACAPEEMNTRGEVSLAESALVHVHGLAIAGDGEVLVATHHGLFSIDIEDSEAPKPAPVSAEAHDFMGFTVVSDDRFLASGHPTFGSQEFADLERPLLGLIESVDGGRSWRSVSLAGAADFHALEAAHGLVYGFEGISGRLVVSDDGGESWEARSDQAMHDLAVDPSDADHVVASTPAGLLESRDGGRSWTPVAEAPALVLVDWHQERGLWGLDDGGRVHSFDDGAGWRLSAELGGSPQALLVDAEGLFAATDDGTTTIHRSANGDDWDVLYRAPAS